MFRKLTSLLLVGAICVAWQTSASATTSALKSDKKTTQISTAGKVPACISKGKRLYGKVFITSSAYQADFKVYQTTSKYQSDLIVWSAKNSYQANKCGIWNFVNQSYQSNFKVYFVKSAYQADFSVFFTNSAYQAGTN